MKRCKKLKTKGMWLIGLFCIFVIGFKAETVYANPYPGGYDNCTWTAWQCTFEETGYQLPAWSYAITWYDSAQQSGFTVSTTPREKSIAVWRDSGLGHVGYVSAVSGNQIYVKEGGYNGGYHEGWLPASGYRNNYQVLVGYIYIPGVGGNNPQGSFDNASGGNGYVDVSGWAFDMDSPGGSIAVHVYVGGPVGSGASCYGVPANLMREDVNRVYNISGNHGFSQRIYTDKTGNQEIYVYAINIGSGQNVELGHKTVNIKKAAQPVISDAKIVEQDSQGYVVQCKVNSESPIDRVQCPTWTILNAQDDICADWWTNTSVRAYQYGEYYRFRVNISEHNNEYGRYRTDIYVYDKSGNYASTGIGAIVKAGIMPRKIVAYDNSLISVYEENMPWTQMKKIAENMGSQLMSINYELDDIGVKTPFVDSVSVSILMVQMHIENCIFC